MILFRYTVAELVFPMGLATGVLSSIMLMDQIYKFVPFLKTSGLEIEPFLLMIVYSLPTILMLSLPISAMIGTYVGINRLSQDYEVIAMRAAGVSMAAFFKPVLFVATCLALVVLGLTMFASPWGARSLEALKYDILKQQTKINLSAGKINNFFGKKSIYVFEKKEPWLNGVVISDWENPFDSNIIEAKQGRILFDETQKKVFLRLYQGRIHQWTQGDKHRILDFAELEYNLAPPSPDRSNLPNRYRDLNEGPSLNDMQMSVGRLVREIKGHKTGSRPYLEYADELHGRIATVLSCLVFSIFALPMGIFDPRNPKTMRFVYMILMMIAYYSFYSKARGMMVQGKVSAIMIYLPLLVALVIGLVNYLKINYDFNTLREWLHTKSKYKKT